MPRKLPSMQFYPGDWLKDPALSLVSAAARGVWIDMLCLMWESEDRGVLCTAGKPWELDQIASSLRGDTDSNRTCIDELLTAGVAKKSKGGAISCRRMVRDEQVREKTRNRVRKHRNGKEGVVAPAVTPDVTQEQRKCNTDSSSSTSTSNQPTRASPAGGLVGGDSVEENSQDPRLAALTRAGVAERNQSDLAALPGMTAEVIDRVNRETRQGGGNAGAVVIALRQESKRIEAEQQAKVRREEKVVSDRSEARANLAESAKALKDERDRLTAIPKAERDRLVAYVIEHTEFWRHRPPENRDPFTNRVLRASVLTEHAKEQKPATNLDPNAGKPEEPF